IRLVNLILAKALESRASDIHIEPFENRLIVRYRIDGVLHETESPPRRLSAAVISRVKIIASLDEVHGILLVTGPTGSGKTTTLYTALDRLNKSDVKIVTVEDPVEYQMPGINQIQVKPQIDLTFANALRSIVRQDPDIIMVGEIRDVE